MASSSSSGKTPTRLALLSDLPQDISEHYVGKDVSLKAKQQGFKYYSENYFEKVKMYKREDTGQINISAKCNCSQRKNDEPHAVNLDITENKLDLAHCSCVAGLVYLLKTLTLICLSFLSLHDKLEAQKAEPVSLTWYVHRCFKPIRFKNFQWQPYLLYAYIIRNI